jgi:hypothetical protein
MLLRFRDIMIFIQSGFSLLPSLFRSAIQWELTLAAVLDNVEDRFGCSHLAYLDVLSMGNLPHFAGGLLCLLCARVDGFPVR